MEYWVSCPFYSAFGWLYFSYFIIKQNGACEIPFDTLLTMLVDITTYERADQVSHLCWAGAISVSCIPYFSPRWFYRCDKQVFFSTVMNSNSNYIALYSSWMLCGGFYWFIHYWSSGKTISNNYTTIVKRTTINNCVI